MSATFPQWNSIFTLSKIGNIQSNPHKGKYTFEWKEDDGWVNFEINQSLTIKCNWARGTPLGFISSAIANCFQHSILIHTSPYVCTRKLTTRAGVVNKIPIVTHQK